MGVGITPIVFYTVIQLNKIYTTRGMQVMLDSDLADLYNVEKTP